LPGGLFKAVRAISLTVGNGKTRPAVQDIFTGPLWSLVRVSLPDPARSSHGYADGVMARAEELGQQPGGAGPGVVRGGRVRGGPDGVEQRLRRKSGGLIRPRDTSCNTVAVGPESSGGDGGDAGFLRTGCGRRLSQDSQPPPLRSEQ
jgi:hypothetical protein